MTEIKALSDQVRQTAFDIQLRPARLEHGLLINFGSYKFEIRKFAWGENQPQGARRTQRILGFLLFAISAFFAVK